ncbi:MAG TPA: SDR family NAD(P)-dependent oxidoreductase [Anaerolineaceae bacterium]|nr:SDR family NAD(P)-dependent oxidoreductase [Anaerolineaceae bacterium]
MKRQSMSDQQRRMALLGILAAAAGLSYAGIRAQRKARVKRWQDHMNRAAPHTALVTGASAGIGKAFAEQLAQMGYQLVLVARRAERLEAQAAEYRSRYGIRAEALSADLSSETGIAKVEQRLSAGDIDFLVNNAGYDVFGSFAHIPIEKNLALLNCLELATVRLTRAALPGMLERRRGAVINVSSVGAFGPKRKDAMYVSAKAFVNRFTESLALDLKESGVRVQALCPGFTLTEFHDAPEYAPYRIKERIPRWLWMQPEQVVTESLRALGEDQTVYVPGIKNRAIVFAAQSGLSRLLMRILGGFFPATQRDGAVVEANPDLLVCPGCQGNLRLDGDIQNGMLSCQACQKQYPIIDGIPRFTDYESLNGPDRGLTRMYDWFSYVYRPFLKIVFAFIGATEDQARFEILDRLEPCGSVLEVSIGPGVNLPYLREYPAVREISGLDLSIGQLTGCQRYAQRNRWPVGLYQGNAETLPFRDNAFDCVFHVGGINFFNDQRKAIAEMIRVAKPGAKIVICDETERGARGFELALPGFKQSFEGKREPVKPPVNLIPAEMEDVQLDETIWKGWFYLVAFHKPAR